MPMRREALGEDAATGITAVGVVEGDGEVGPVGDVSAVMVQSLGGRCVSNGGSPSWSLIASF